MTNDETKITTYYSIIAILLRELRVQRGLQKAQFADFFAKHGLMKRAKDYWDTHGGKFRDNGNMLMQSPGLFAPYLQNNMWYRLIPVFQYAVDEQFRTQQSDPENFKLPVFEPQVQVPIEADGSF